LVDIRSIYGTIDKLHILDPAIHAFLTVKAELSTAGATTGAGIVTVADCVISSALKYSQFKL